MINVASLSKADVLARHGAFADANALVASAFAALMPPVRMSVAEWAESSRWVTSPGFVGRYGFDGVPFLRAPTEALTSEMYATTCVVGPGQVGKTMVPENWLAWSVEHDPADFLWFLNTEAVKDAYVKTVIEQVIRDHPVMRRRLGGRPIDNSLSFKRFDGMVAEFLAAVRSNVLNKKATRMVLDEVDGYGPDLDDVLAIFDVRRQTIQYGSMLLALSHPDKATGLDPDEDWNAGIMAIYRPSTRGRWWWPCPRCGGYSSPVPGAARFMALDYDAAAPLDEIAGTARMRCPLCDGKFDDRERHAMNTAGLWAGLGQEVDRDGRLKGTLVRRDISGWWVVGAMSPYTLGGWGGLARRRVEAERAFARTGDDQGLRDVMSKGWGVPYERAKVSGVVNAQVLVDRVEGFRLGLVPDVVRCLFASIDVNKTWFEVLVIGLSDTGELWTVDHFKVLRSFDALGQEQQVDPARRASDWDLLTDLVVDRAWPLASDPTRGMRPRGVICDSAGEDGVTRQAYNWWRRLRDRTAADDKAAPLTRREGVIDGRDVWTMLLSKGLSGVNQPRLTVAYPDSGRKDRTAGATGDVPVAQFNPKPFKDDLASQFEQLEAGSGYVHLSDDLLNWDAETGEAVAPHPFFDQLAAEAPDKSGRWQPVKAGIRNEAWDLFVLILVLLHLWGARKYDWRNPPAWGRPVNDNPLVVPLAVASDAPATAIEPSGRAGEDAPPVTIRKAGAPQPQSAAMQQTSAAAAAPAAARASAAKARTVAATAVMPSNRVSAPVVVAPGARRAAPARRMVPPAW